MKAIRTILFCFSGWVIAMGLAGRATAEPVRDQSVPMRVAPHYDKARLVGHWFEVARSRSLLEPDCHGVTAEVATREDSRLTLKIACHKSSVGGPVLNIDGILVEIAPGVFHLRLVRLQQLGEQTVAVLWQAEEASLAVLGSPEGRIGWVWSKTSTVDPETLASAIEKLVAAGYSRRAIKKVDHAR